MKILKFSSQIFSNYLFAQGKWQVDSHVGKTRCKSTTWSSDVDSGIAEEGDGRVDDFGHNFNMFDDDLGRFSKRRSNIAFPVDNFKINFGFGNFK